MEQGNGIKVYVRVKVQFDEEGRMRPQAILWEDGRRFEIEKVTDIRPAPALRAGGQGDRYTVRIGKRESYLFFERLAFPAGCVQGRWFVERRRG